MKKISLIGLALVLAVGMLGVGYALWEKTVYIDAVVNTGEVNMIITDVSSSDTGIDPGKKIDGSDKDKDVGSTVVKINPEDNQRATVTVYNAYPSYENSVHFSVWNNGTVPVRLQGITITNPNACVNITAWNGHGEQIHPGPINQYEPVRTMANNTVWFHILQCAEENRGGEGGGEPYAFMVEFNYVQYNEYVP